MTCTGNRGAVCPQIFVGAERQHSLDKLKVLMRWFVKWRWAECTDFIAVLLGVWLSLLAVGGYVIFENNIIRSAREVEAGYDTLWHSSSVARQLIILALFCLPATLGAVISAWFARRPMYAACWVTIAYFLVVFAPLFSDDNLPYPLTDVVDLQPWITLGMLLVNLVILPLTAAAVVAAARTARTATGRSP